MREHCDHVKRLRAIAEGERRSGRGEAATDIELAARKLEVASDIAGMLRAQIRMHGMIPCVLENAEIGQVETAMRNRARGN